MKIKSLLAALLVLTCLVAASCQKEPAPEPQPTTLDAVVAYTVSYSIDGQSNTMVVNGEGELTVFLRYLNMHARHGHSVEMALEGVEGSATATKDSQTITGASESEILAWETARLREGYRVTITFDTDTGTYSGVAIMALSASVFVGNSWRAIVVDDYLEWHFEDEFTYTFFTADSGVLHKRPIIVAGRTIRGNEQSDWEYDIPFHYTVENKMVYVAFESGRNKNLYYNERSNTIVTSEGYDRVVYHQVTD